MLKRVLVAVAAAAVFVGGTAAPAAAQVVRICHGEGDACPFCIQNHYVDICFL